MAIEIPKMGPGAIVHYVDGDHELCKPAIVNQVHPPNRKGIPEVRISVLDANDGFDTQTAQYSEDGQNYTWHECDIDGNCAFTEMLSEEGE